jgi:hypothetical protein
MKINLTKSYIVTEELNDVKKAYSKLVLLGFQFILLFVLVFFTINTFAQVPVAAVTMTHENQPKKLDLVKQTAVVNGGKVYVNWIAKSNAPDCIYVIERSDNQLEFEPVGLKEGVGSSLELLYSWVDNKPATDATQYRIKQIDNEGALMAESDARTVTVSPSSPAINMDRATKTAKK